MRAALIAQLASFFALSCLPFIFVYMQLSVQASVTLDSLASGCATAEADERTCPLWVAQQILPIIHAGAANVWRQSFGWFARSATMPAEIAGCGAGAHTPCIVNKYRPTREEREARIASLADAKTACTAQRSPGG